MISKILQQADMLWETLSKIKTMSTVNIDYIACVKKLKDGNLAYEEVAVEKPNRAIIKRLHDMVENPYSTIFDIQALASKLILTNEVHKVCIPHCYSSTYIPPLRRPLDVSYSEYQQKISQEKSDLEKKKEEKEAKGEDFSVEEGLQRYVKSLKQDYIRNLNNYVNADEYVVQISRIKQNPDYLMHSTENIGWTVFNYPISDSVNFEVKTNFGYGRSAYFYVNLTYKGIKIIPYSDIVRYYYANMEQFGHYTRQYQPQRKNWAISLNFVIETANLAHKNPDEFIRVKIQKELDEMMSGLRQLKRNPYEVISSFKRKRNTQDGYLTVRNIQGEEIRDHKAYPQEAAVAYKAYKISGALHFLENMYQLEQLYEFVSTAIDELKAINRSILPEIELSIDNINKTIYQLEISLQISVDKLKVNEAILRPLESTLATLLKESNENKNTEIQELFNIQHPNFLKLQAEHKELTDDIERKRSIIQKRQNFKESLENSLSLINENTSLSDAIK